MRMQSIYLGLKASITKVEEILKVILF